MKPWAIALAAVAVACTQPAPPTGAQPDARAGATSPAARGSPAPTRPAARAGKAPRHAYPAEMIERGRALAMLGSCHDCHTPWVYDERIGALAPDMSRALSGHPADGPDPQGQIGPADMALIGPTFTSFEMPFGVVYANNLTPDIDTGTGSWTEQLFIDIFRKGTHLGGDGRPVLPPMPWMDYRALSDEELRALFAYLRSLPPIRNAPPDARVPAPAMEAIRRMNDKIVALQANPKARLPAAAAPAPPPLDLGPVAPGQAPRATVPPELVARGRKLVMAGACNDCHTPWLWNPVLGSPAPDPSRMLSGHPAAAPDPGGELGPNDIALIGPTFTSFTLPFGTVYAQNLTPDLETGLGRWTEQQFLDVFQRGLHPNGTAVMPPMPWPMVRRIARDDLRAIFAFLRTLPPISNRVPPAKVSPEARRQIRGINDRIIQSEK